MQHTDLLLDSQQVTPMTSPLFTPAIAAIDACNAEDPRQDQDEQGRAVPYELLYSQRMSQELARFVPQASEALQLAARAQHLERWKIARSEYSMDRTGYLNWRNDLKKWHAERARALLLQVGYDQPMQDRVASLILKEKFKSDTEGQQLEDVICLVFLRYYFAEFATQHSEEKICDIIAKTWRKMSEVGHTAALTLPFTPEQQQLLHKALA